MRVFLFVFMCFSFYSYNAFAEENEKIQTQGELNEISKNEFDEAKKELNDVYSELGAYYHDESRDKYIKAQEAWIKYRDAHCDAVTNEAKGGSAFYLFYFSCLTYMTEQRIELLRILYQDISQKSVKGKPLKSP